MVHKSEVSLRGTERVIEIDRDEAGKVGARKKHLYVVEIPECLHLLC